MGSGAPEVHDGQGARAVPKLALVDMGLEPVQQLRGREVEAEPDRAVPAFDEVYSRHFSTVYRFVARLMGGGDVEDAVQEVFLVVHRRLPEFRGDAKVTTWLFRIAYHVVQAKQRKLRLNRALVSALSVFQTQEQRHPALAAEQARQVQAALSALSLKKRSVLVLHEIEGWSGPQIAEALAIPIDTVYTRLHHARKDFRKQYERLASSGAGGLERRT